MTRSGRASVLAVLIAVAGCAYVGASEITVINTTAKPIVVRDMFDHEFLIGACETRKINPDNRGDQVDAAVPLPSDAVVLWQSRLPQNFEMRIIATVVVTPDGMQVLSENGPKRTPRPCEGDPPNEPSMPPAPIRSANPSASPAA